MSLLVPPFRNLFVMQQPPLASYVSAFFVPPIFDAIYMNAALVPPLIPLPRSYHAPARPFSHTAAVVCCRRDTQQSRFRDRSRSPSLSSLSDTGSPKSKDRERNGLSRPELLSVEGRALAGEEFPWVA